MQSILLSKPCFSIVSFEYLIKKLIFPSESKKSMFFFSFYNYHKKNYYFFTITMQKIIFTKSIRIFPLNLKPLFIRLSFFKISHSNYFHFQMRVVMLHKKMKPTKTFFFLFFATINFLSKIFECKTRFFDIHIFYKSKS